MLDGFVGWILVGGVIYFVGRSIEKLIEERCDRIERMIEATERHRN